MNYTNQGNVDAVQDVDITYSSGVVKTDRIERLQVV